MHFNVLRICLLAACVLFTAATNANADNEVIVANGCTEDITVMVRHAPEANTLKYSGWWTIKPKEELALTQPDGSPILHMTGEELLLYAEGKHTIWENKFDFVNFKGRRLGLTRTSYVGESDTKIKTTIYCPTYASGKAKPLTDNELFVENRCHEKIEFVLRYQPEPGKWVNRGKWEINGLSQYYPTINDGKFIKHLNTTDHVLFWGKSQTYTWEGNEKTITMDGKEYNLRKINLKPYNKGDSSLILTCG